MWYTGQFNSYWLRMASKTCCKVVLRVLWNCSWVPLTSLISVCKCAQSCILMHKVWSESAEYYFSSFWLYMWDFKLLREPLAVAIPSWLESKTLNGCLSQCMYFHFKELSLSRLGFVRQLSPTDKKFERLFSSFSQGWYRASTVINA